MNVPPCAVEEFSKTDNNTTHATQEDEERVHRRHHIRRDFIPRAVPRKPSSEDNVGLLLPYYDDKDDNGQEIPVKHSSQTANTSSTAAITSKGSRTSRNKSLVVEEKQKMHPTKSSSHQNNKLKRKVRFYDPTSMVGPKYSFDTSEEDDRSVLQEASAESSPSLSDSTSSYLLQKQIFQYPAIPRECYPEVFWTRSEQKVGLAQQKAMARFYTKRHPQLVASVYSLYGYDIKKRKKPNKQQPASQQKTDQPEPPGEKINTEEDSQDHDPAKHYPIHSLHHAQTILTESESRGLEPYMTSLISQHRHWGIAKVLTIQQQCREKIQQKKQQLQQQQQPPPNDIAAPAGNPKIDTLEQTDVENDDSMETILSIWSQRVSQATCRYARHLGLGDQAVAYQLQLEDNEPNDGGHRDTPHGRVGSDQPKLSPPPTPAASSPSSISKAKRQQRQATPSRRLPSRGVLRGYSDTDYRRNNLYDRSRTMPVGMFGTF